MAQEQVKKFLGKLTPEDHGGVEGGVVFTMGNGSQLVAKLSRLTPETVQRLAIHGLSQKVGDAASSYAKERDFLGAFASMQAVWETLLAGGWNQKAGGGTSDLVAALAQLKKCSLEDAQAAVGKADEEQVKALKKHPEVKRVMLEIAAKRAKEAAKASGGEDLGDLLKGLM